MIPDVHRVTPLLTATAIQERVAELGRANPIRGRRPLSGRYGEGMSACGNLADPAYEPSDADLARLMHDAFEHVRDAREESLRTMRARIERLQAEARARFDAHRRTSAGP